VGTATACERSTAQPPTTIAASATAPALYNLCNMPFSWFRPGKERRLTLIRHDFIHIVIKCAVAAIFPQRPGAFAIL